MHAGQLAVEKVLTVTMIKSGTKVAVNSSGCTRLAVFLVVDPIGSILAAALDSRGVNIQCPASPLIWVSI